MRHFKYVVLLGAAIVAGAATADAHGVWVAERWGKLGIVYGHGASDDAYDPAKIKSLSALDSSGRTVEIKVDARDKLAFAEASVEPAVVLLHFDNGFYTQGPDGKWVNQPKHAVAGAQKAGRYLKHAVSIVHLDGEVPSLPPQPLQIVSLANPTGLSSGQSFKVRVLFEGKPLEGVEITPDYVNQPETTLGRTDARGVAEVVVRNDGLNVVAVKHESPLADNLEADLVQHFATLSFVAGHHEED